MLKITCTKCEKELTELGALFFTSPVLDLVHNQQTVNKYHICQKCEDVLIDWLNMKPIEMTTTND